MSSRAVLVVLLGLNLIAAAWSWAVDGVTPSWVVYPLLLLVVVLLLKRGARPAAAYLAFVAALFVLVHVGFVREAFADSCEHPADASLACHPVTWVATLGVVPLATAVTAAGVWLRSRHDRAEPIVREPARP